MTITKDRLSALRSLSYLVNRDFNPTHRGLRFCDVFHGEYGIASDGGQGTELPGSYHNEAIQIAETGQIAFQIGHGWLKQGPWVELAEEIISELEMMLASKKDEMDRDKARQEELEKQQALLLQQQMDRRAVDAFLSAQPK